MTMTIRALEMKLRYYVGLRELRPYYIKEDVSDVGGEGFKEETLTCEERGYPKTTRSTKNT